MSGARTWRLHLSGRTRRVYPTVVCRTGRGPPGFTGVPAPRLTAPSAHTPDFQIVLNFRLQVEVPGAGNFTLERGDDPKSCPAEEEPTAHPETQYIYTSHPLRNAYPGAMLT
ncbi:hypothetical protein H4Q26_016275 [Puccinia striiformis f. sp. tritici PST-130]|nr:hypothetical protein H4Q26_016275 [Puccinia striiformis f. sp. tritici PST-130]